MTPATRLHAALTALRWSGRSLAIHIGLNERTVRRWHAGTSPLPPNILQWLERLATFHNQNPPPAGKERV